MSMFTGSILGRLGSDPEMRSSKNGNEVCSVTVATDSGFGENKVTTWTKLVAFGKTAEFICKYFHKGDQIYCAGEIKLDKWEDKDGNERQTLTMMVSHATFGGGQKKEEEGAGRKEDTRRDEGRRDGARRDEGRRDGARRDEGRRDGGF